jgi:hypothetical protein
MARLCRWGPHFEKTRTATEIAEDRNLVLEH